MSSLSLDQAVLLIRCEKLKIIWLWTHEIYIETLFLIEKLAGSADILVGNMKMGKEERSM
jgi:hypothetical protein